MCDCMERDEWQQTWARPGCEKMPFNRQREGSFSLGRAELRVYEQYWRNDFHRHLSMLLWNSEDWRRNGAPSAGPGMWFTHILLSAVDCWVPLIGTYRTCNPLCTTDTPEGCGYWWSHSVAQHTRHIPLKTTFFFFNWLVHLLLVKYKSFLEEKMFFY